MFLDADDISRDGAKLGQYSFGPPNVDRDDAGGSLFKLGEPFTGVGHDRAGRRGRPGSENGTVGSVQSCTASHFAVVGPSCARIGEVRAFIDARWLGLGSAHKVMPLGGIVPGNQNIIVVGWILSVMGIVMT